MGLDKCTLNFLASDHVVYQSVTSIFQVINFCQKAKAKLVLAALLDDHIINYIQNFPNLIVLYKLWGRDIENQFLDVGTDSKHPGIKTHEFYANQIYQKLVALT